jgi:hypothetical protein
MRVPVFLAVPAAALAAFAAAQTASGSTASSPAPAAGGIEAALISAATRLAAAATEQAPASPAAASPAAASPASPGVEPGTSRRDRRAHARLHPLVRVRRPVALSDRPGGPTTLRIGATTEFGSPRVLAVAARRGDWLGVVTTERPNNRLAWVRRGGGALTQRRTRWSLHADLSARTLTLRRAGRRVHRLPVAIGRSGSETPTGRFAVTDKLSGSSFGPYYGCCILALSGHQPNTPPGWTGGDRIGIHGTDAPSTIGAAASAGCLRAADNDLQMLMRTVPLGAPVFVRR